MSKKLIAVAAAAALALTGLVGIAPAIAAPSATFTAGTSGGTTTGTSSTAPAEIIVPDTNALTVGTNVATLTITGLLSKDVVRVTSTGAVKLIEAGIATNKAYDVTTFGKTSIEKTRTDTTDLVLYAFTTSTTTGTVDVNVVRTGLNSTSTLHLKGLAGNPYNVVDVAGVPATLAKNATATVTYKLTDVFGNALEGETSGVTLTPSANLATHAIASGLAGIGWDSTAKNYKTTLTALEALPFLVDISISSDPSVDGFKDANYKYTTVVNNAAVATANAAATAQIAALTAQLAESRPKATSVTKKRYNTLARKWNAAFPSQKVALKQ
jgi:hypothetical protein